MTRKIDPAVKARKIDPAVKARVIEMAVAGIWPHDINQAMPDVRRETIYNIIQMARAAGVVIPRATGARRTSTPPVVRVLIGIEDPCVLADIDRHALARRLSRRELLTQVVMAVFDDDLVDAVLDDDGAADGDG